MNTLKIPNSTIQKTANSKYCQIVVVTVKMNVVLVRKITVNERIIKCKSNDLYVHVLEISVVLSRDDNRDQTVSYYGYVNGFSISPYASIYISLDF